MKWTTTIKKVGPKAINPKESIVILFGENVNPDLAEVSIIQKAATDNSISDFIFKKGDTVTIDGKTYVASFVGSMVESNMRALLHASLYFNSPAPKHPLANAVYFEKDEEGLPNFKLDEDIVYEHI